MLRRRKNTIHRKRIAKLSEFFKYSSVVTINFKLNIYPFPAVRNKL